MEIKVKYTREISQDELITNLIETGSSLSKKGEISIELELMTTEQRKLLFEKFEFVKTKRSFYLKNDNVIDFDKIIPSNVIVKEKEDEEVIIEE